jgi:hypothetical protein
MNIQSEIRDYINAHDFVMLPGIGAFLAEYSKPYFDTNGNIVPPERKIRFNPHIRNDSDVEILQVFRYRLNISNDEVQNLYFDFLEKLDKTIASNGRFHWDGLGILFKDSEEKILQFVSTQTSEALKPSEVVTTEVKNSTYIPPVVIPPAIIPQRENALEQIQEPEEYQPYTYERKSESGIIKFLIFALPLALLAGALIYMVFYKPSANNSVKYNNAAEVMQESDFGNDSVEIDTLLNDPAPAPVVIEEKPAKEHIVGIGIYKNNKDADKIATFLAEEGYPSRVRPYGSLYKVYLVANSESQALQYVTEVEQLIRDKPVYER